MICATFSGNAVGLVPQTTDFNNVYTLECHAPVNVCNQRLVYHFNRITKKLNPEK